MPPKNAYQKLLEETFKDLSPLQMLEHIVWEIRYFSNAMQKASSDSDVHQPEKKSMVQRAKEALTQ